MKKNVCLHYLPCSEDYKKQHCNSNASVHFATPFPTVNCQLSTGFTPSAPRKKTLKQAIPTLAPAITPPI